jgi:FMN phosphatase YigB (HAD superfamily)
LIPKSRSVEDYFADFQLVMFDLDDTLFEERAYLASAYREIATELSRSVEEEKIYSRWLEETCLTQGRSQLFQKFFKEFNLGEPDIPHLLNRLRNHKVAGGLRYFSWVPKALEYIEGKCALVTNGNPIQQRNKLTQLLPEELTERFEVFLANEVAPKPSPKVFSLIREVFEVEASQCLMVGDSDTDLKFANSIGVDFLPVRSLELVLGQSATKIPGVKDLSKPR